MSPLLDAYELKLAAGEIQPDADQLRAVQALDELGRHLAGTGRSGFLDKIFHRKSGVSTPKGYYLYGGVGRGKSMVMDLFFAAAPIEKKRLVHFHAFMLEAHDFLHEARVSRTTQGRIDGDLLALADKIATDARLLCFDEFQVKDVADAMILGRLFTALFERGVTVVMTSNIAPDDLYAGGLQRDRFTPFIEMLKSKLHIFFFEGEADYRLNRLRERQVYFWPHDADAELEMNRIFMAISDGLEGGPLDIPVKSRIIHVPRAAREVAEFTFEELCVQPKSALDYLELAKRFRVFIVKDVPELTDNRRDATTRFITLIDTLYDRHARLIISAAAPPDRLYHGDDNAETFRRTISRLMEMQSREYRV